jgi:hypothetical protein
MATKPACGPAQTLLIEDALKKIVYRDGEKMDRRRSCTEMVRECLRNLEKDPVEKIVYRDGPVMVRELL